MVTRPHTRESSFGLPSGTQPLQNGASLSFPGGYSVLRTRIQAELYVEAVSSTGNLVNFLAMTATRAAIGVTVYDTPTLQASTSHPLTTLTDPVNSKGWIVWSPLTPTVDFFKESDVETAVWTYRADPIMLDVQTRAKTTAGNNPTWWWAYDLKQDSGTNFINQTVAGTTYALGWRVHYDVLFETF